MKPDGSRRAQLGLYVRTVRYLRPSQLVWRVRLRAQRQLLGSSAGGRVRPLLSRRAAPADAGWPAGFDVLDEQRFRDATFVSDFVDGRITLLASAAKVEDGWRHLDQPQLWRFHLHYWDWAWHLYTSLDADEFRTLFADNYRAWKRDNPWGRGDAWSPYVVSLRLWTLCGLHRTLATDEQIGQEVIGDICDATDFLRWHCEYDVGGNHLLKNLKALIGGAVFLGDERLVRRSLRAIEDQITVQVLRDGGHFERSPAYHAQVLGDLIDIEQLLTHAGLEPADGMRSAIARMRTWLQVMAGPGRLAPAFNDGPCVGEDELDLLGVQVATHDPLRWLAESGYVVANPNERVHLVMDVGDPCPDELPAHAQADCLSFTLMVDGRPVVVDTGTSEYGAGPRRAYERSTAAHNTVEVDGQSQTEVWGAFRAATRARPRVLEVGSEGDTIVVEAEHDGYLRLEGRPVHRRRLTLSPTELQVTDRIRGRGDHMSASRLYLGAPSDSVRRMADDRLVASGVEVSASCTIAVVDDTHANAFGEHRPCSGLQQRCSGPLPHELSWVLTWRTSATHPAGELKERDQ